MALDDVLGGAGKGASIGGLIGSVVPGIGTAIGSGIGGLLGGAIGGLSGRKKQTKTQKRQEQLIDSLLKSLKGEGPYSDLFTANQADFERSFAEPARQRFRSQTAPQIQQQYIAGGQQRSTGLEDTLARAGVDMDQLLNQHYLQYQQGKQANKAGIFNTLLNAPDTGMNQSAGSAIGQGIGGYLAGGGAKDIGDIIGSFFNKGANAQDQNSLNDTYRPPSRGYEQENQVYNPYTGVMG